MTTGPSRSLTLEEDMKHFMIDDECQNRSWNLRRIENRAYRNGLMHRIVMSEPPPAVPSSPAKLAYLNLVIEVAGIRFTKNLRQGVMRGISSPQSFPTTCPPPLLDGGNDGSGAPICVVESLHFWRRQSTKDLAGQYPGNGLQERPGRALAVITHPNMPSLGLPANCVGQSNIRVELSEDRDRSKNRRRSLEHRLNNLLQLGVVHLVAISRQLFRCNASAARRWLEENSLAEQRCLFRTSYRSPQCLPHACLCRR